MNPYNRYKVYGPYVRNSDGRKIIRVVSKDNKGYTLLYARYLLEMSIGRHLDKDENVHHLDNDKSNDVIENLEIVKFKLHQNEHSIRYPLTCIVVCVRCKKEFSLTRKQQSERARNAKRVKSGPFCSRACSGLYGKEQQSNNRLLNAVKFGETSTNGNAELSLKIKL